MRLCTCNKKENIEIKRIKRTHLDILLKRIPYFCTKCGKKIYIPHVKIKNKKKTKKKVMVKKTNRYF